MSESSRIVAALLAGLSGGMATGTATHDFFVGLFSFAAIFCAIAAIAASRK